MASPNNMTLSFPHVGHVQPEIAPEPIESGPEGPPAFPSGSLTPGEMLKNLASGDITNKRLFSVAGMGALVVSQVAKHFTAHQTNVTEQRLAIVAEGVRLERDPNRTIRHRRQIVQAIAVADSLDKTYEDVLIDRGYSPGEIDTYALAARAYLPSRRGRQVLRLAAGALLMFGAYELGGESSVSTPKLVAGNLEVTKSKLSDVLSPKKASGDAKVAGVVVAKPAETTVETTTTTASTTTTIPKPKMSAFQLSLAKPIMVELSAGFTVEQAVQTISVVTGERWDVATFKAYIGEFPANFAGGKVRVNDCRGENVDLIRPGDKSIGDIAKESNLSVEELTKLNDGNVMLAKVGSCIRKVIKLGGV